MNPIAFIVNLLLSAVAVAVSAYLLPGVRVDTFITAVWVALVLGLLNAFVKPALLFLTLPINILTLGLFTFVIMALVVMLAAAVIPGFKVDNFWWSLAFALVLAIISSLLDYFKVE